MLALAWVTMRPAPVETREMVWIDLSAGAPVAPVSKPTPVRAPRKAVAAPALPREVAPATVAESERSPQVSDMEISEEGGGTAIALSERDRYIAEIVRYLNGRKRYPQLALRLRQQGTIVVKFRLDRNGRVLEADLVQKTPFETLNQSAKNLIQEIQGLRPFPDSVKDQTWLFTVPIEYRM